MTNPSSKTVGERPKVKRYNFNAGIGATEHPEGVLVKSSDYDTQSADIESKDEQISGLEQRLREEKVSHQSTMQALRAAEASNASLVERVGKLEEQNAVYECSLQSISNGNNDMCCAMPYCSCPSCKADKALLEGAKAVTETREQRADRFMLDSGKEIHTNTCATSRAPAEEPGPCDCEFPQNNAALAPAEEKKA